MDITIIDSHVNLVKKYLNNSPADLRPQADVLLALGYFRINEPFQNLHLIAAFLPEIQCAYCLRSSLTIARTNAQQKDPKQRRKGTLNIIGDDENSDIDGTEINNRNGDAEDNWDRRNRLPSNRNNVPDRNKPFDRNNDENRDDDAEDDADHLNRRPDKKNNRNNVPDRKRPWGREQDEDQHDSDEASTSKDRKRKHGKKDKHMKKDKHWKKKKHGRDHPPCIKHGKNHPGCLKHRKHHHHHHHEDNSYRLRRPNHRRTGNSEEGDEDAFIDKNRDNKGRGKGQKNRDKESSARQRGEPERNPKNDQDNDFERNPNDRNRNDDLE